MPGTVETYDPALVNINLAGNALAGLAPDTYLEIEWETEQFSDQVGAGGEVTRVRVRDGRATVKFSTLQGSQVNDILSGLLSADLKTATGVAAFLMSETNGTTEVSAESAWIRKIPKVERAKELKVVDWEIRLADATQTWNVGGLG